MSDSDGGRLVTYGYRVGEVPLPTIKEVKVSTRVKFDTSKLNVKDRFPVRVSLGCNVKGVAQPVPDPSDPQTVLAGSLKRFACEPPKCDDEKLSRFGAFVDKWIHDNLRPLPCDADVSFETWIVNRPYPECRINELFMLWKKYGGRLVDIVAIVKSFLKDESYDIQPGATEYKHGRAINSRHDLFKITVGPYFSAIENVLYELPQFIKHVPVSDRGNYIYNYIYSPDATYFETDYETFESLFRKKLMMLCEMKLYKFMLQDLPSGLLVYKLIERVLTGKNKCFFRGFRLDLLATRMSGEMNTSLGNGFSNLMFMLFLCSEKGCSDVRMVVEGDDGLGRVTGEMPTTEDFASLGLRVKLLKHRRLSTAGFCGLIFDETDKIVVTDPYDVLANFGWTTRRYLNSKDSVHKALLRCKALSMAHQYPGCPILTSLAQYALRVTAGVDVRRVLNRRVLNTWEREQLVAAVASRNHNLRVTPPLNTRFLVENAYGIKVEDQISTEKYLDELNVITELQLPPSVVAGFQSRKIWVDYYDRYSDRVLPGEARFVGAPNRNKIGQTFNYPWESDLGPSNFGILMLE